MQISCPKRHQGVSNDEKKMKKSEETKPSLDRWSIFRDKHMPYADAYPTMNSTLKTLADKLGLDMDDALRQWNTKKKISNL